MIWLSVIQYLSTAVLAYLAFHLTFHPVDKDENKVKIAYTILIIVCILAAGVVSVYQAMDTQKQQTETERHFNEFKTNLLQSSENQKKELNKQIGYVTNQLNIVNGLRQQYENLMAYILTNKSIGPDEKQSAIESYKKFEVLNSQLDDLNDWEAKFRSKVMEKRASEQIDKDNHLKAKQAEYKNSIQCFNYTITTFINMLKKVADRKGDSVVSDYQSLPPAIISEESINVAEIKFETNADWDFKITLFSRGDPFWQLNIDAKDGGRFCIDSGGDNILDCADFHDSGARFSMDNYKKTIYDDLGEFIAYEDTTLSKTNK
jgi:hypothetical protein